MKLGITKVREGEGQGAFKVSQKDSLKAEMSN